MNSGFVVILFLAIRQGGKIQINAKSINKIETFGFIEQYLLKNKLK
jgi:hypothetical protein